MLFQAASLLEKNEMKLNHFVGGGLLDTKVRQYDGIQGQLALNYFNQ